jgi:streptogramin lyase
MTGKGLKVAIVSLLVSGAAMVAPALARAAAITEYTTGVTSPGEVVIGADGNGWFINGAGIAKIDSSGHVTTYSAGLNTGATPYDLTSGPNNDLWFTDIGTTKAVGYITTSGMIHEYAAPAGQDPQQIIAGSDGNLWFYSSGATHAVGKMTPGGTFTATPYALPTGGEIADNMVVGPDMDIWFSDTEGSSTNAIDKIAPNGVVTQYPILTTSPFPTNITIGADGNLWFSDNNGSIGRITTSGTIHEFTTGLQTGAIPDAITAGPDGNVWFTDQYAGQRAIGRITPAGQITEFKTGLSSDLPLDITAGADGNLWVPQAAGMFPTTAAAVAEITPSGQITEITAGVNPTGLQDGDSITPGADGSLWFTDNGSAAKAVGRIVLAPIVSTGASSAVTSTGATVSGSVTPLANATTVTIEYGTTTALGSSVTVGSLAASTSKLSVTGTLTGLPSATTIFYRIAATNSAGESDGTIATLTTASPPPPPPPPTPLPAKTSATFDNQRITLTTPATSLCTAHTGKLPVSLNSTAIRNSKQAKLKFSSAAFYVDKGIRHTAKKIVRRHGKKVTIKVVTFKPNALLKKLPASPKLTLSGLKSGQHTLNVVLFYRETIKKHGHTSNKAVTRALAAKFKVC